MEVNWLSAVDGCALTLPLDRRNREQISYFKTYGRDYRLAPGSADLTFLIIYEPDCIK